VATLDVVETAVETRWTAVASAFALGMALGYLMGWHRSAAKWKAKHEQVRRRTLETSTTPEEKPAPPIEKAMTSGDVLEKDRTHQSMPESIQHSIEDAVERCRPGETASHSQEVQSQPRRNMLQAPDASAGLSEFREQLSAFAKENQLERDEYFKMAQLVIKWRKCQLQERQQKLQESLLCAQRDSLSVQRDANTIAKGNLHLSGSKLTLRKKQDKRQITEEGVEQFRKTFADDLFTGLSLMVLSLVLAGWHLGRLADVSYGCEDLPALSPLSKLVLEMVPGMAELRWGICMTFTMGQVTFSFLVLLFLSYWLLRRGTVSRYQSTPVTILVVLLGIVGGGVGKFVVDGVGGDGLVWMLLWELFLVCHVLAVKRADVLYHLLGLHRRKLRFLPQWAYKFLVHGALAVVLPVITSIAPFLWPSGSSPARKLVGSQADISWNL